jgi:hypothetical protein
MKVYIVLHQVPYQFGEVLSVHSTEEMANEAVLRHLEKYVYRLSVKLYRKENLSVQEWEVDAVV